MIEWIVVGFLLCLFAGCASLLVRSIRLRRELASLRNDVGVFTEASIRVAQTLDGLMQGDVAPRQASQASRRYLINQARQGIAGGEALPALAERLSLSHDEVALLRTTAA